MSALAARLARLERRLAPPRQGFAFVAPPGLGDAAYAAWRAERLATLPARAAGVLFVRIGGPAAAAGAPSSAACGGHGR